jgi:HEAT repeat protein
LDYADVRRLFDDKDTDAILGYLRSQDTTARRAVARELLSKLKLVSRIDDLRYLAPILLPAATSTDPEVLDATARALSRLATESWQTYYPYHDEALPLLASMVARKHQGIRGSAAQALVATALQLPRPELAESVLRHPSPKLKAAAIGALMRCREQHIDISPCVPSLITLLPGAHKRVEKAIERTLRDWLVEGQPTREHRQALRMARDQLASLGDGPPERLAEVFAEHLGESASVDDVDRLFSDLDHTRRAVRLGAIRKLYPLFHKLVVLAEDMPAQITKALAHDDPQVREDIAHMLSLAEEQRGRPLSLLSHPDEAVRRGAHEVQKIQDMWVRLFGASAARRTEAQQASAAKAIAASRVDPAPAPRPVAPAARIVAATGEARALLDKSRRFGASADDHTRMSQLARDIASAIAQLSETVRAPHPVFARWADGPGDLVEDVHDLERCAKQLRAPPL